MIGRGGQCAAGGQCQTGGPGGGQGHPVPATHGKSAAARLRQVNANGLPGRGRCRG